MSLVSNEEWEEFKNKFEKSYKDESEEKMRRELYQKNKAMVEEHNKKYDEGLVSWSMGLNHLSDLTEEEYKGMCGFRPPPENK